MDESEKLKLTKAEIGRIGGLIGGPIGGKSTSDSKQTAARENGKLGGRPRKYASNAERQRAYLERKKSDLIRLRGGV